MAAWRDADHVGTDKCCSLCGMAGNVANGMCVWPTYVCHGMYGICIADGSIDASPFLCNIVCVYCCIIERQVSLQIARAGARRHGRTWSMAK